MRTPIRIVLGILVTGIVIACTLFALAQTKSRTVNSYPIINVVPSRATRVARKSQLATGRARNLPGADGLSGNHRSAWRAAMITSRSTKACARAKSSSLR